MMKGGLMLIIIADRGGIAGAAIKQALKAHLKGAEVKSLFVWEDVEHYLMQGKETIVVSAQTIKGFDWPSDFAKAVKRVNPEAGFFVYNGGQQELCPDIDGYLPSCPMATHVASVFVPFFQKVVDNRSRRPSQLQLF